MPKKTKYFCIKVKKETPTTTKNLSALLKLVIHYEYCNKKGKTLYGFDAKLTKNYIDYLNGHPNKKVLFFISQYEGSKKCNGFVFVAKLTKIYLSNEVPTRIFIPNWFKENYHKNYLLLENFQWVNNKKICDAENFRTENGVKIENINGAFSIIENIK